VHARSGAKVKAYEQVYRRFALKRFDAALTVCSSDRDILLASGLEPRRVFVHLNGVDRPALGFADRIARQAEVRSAWVSDLGLELEGKVVFGVVARLAAEKNHDLLLRSLAHLRAQGKGDPNWVCICFGTGPLDQELREKTHALGLEKNLRWAGYRARLSEEMAGFDFLVSLSKGEGLPINLLEAGWARTPILATAVDGVQDLLPAHQPEWAFSRLPATADPALITEFIQRLISDPDLRLSLSNALFERTRSHFSGLAWRARLLEIYQDIHKFI
jgi:glycosyltransferase involved in cell wall biosynthesis